MLSKVASSSIFWVFGMTRQGIEPRSPGPLAKFDVKWPEKGWYVVKQNNQQTNQANKQNFAHRPSRLICLGFFEKTIVTNGIKYSNIYFKNMYISKNIKIFIKYHPLFHPVNRILRIVNISERLTLPFS